VADLFVEVAEWWSELEPEWKVLTIVGAGGIAVVGGVFAAPAVGAALSTAGLGVAGGTLSGAAASSAGLAALGGGSIASGGARKAGVTAVTATTFAIASVGSATCGSAALTKCGARSKAVVDEAKNQTVKGGGIRLS
jgi:hypothetical protein